MSQTVHRRRVIYEKFTHSFNYLLPKVITTNFTEDTGDLKP